MRPTRPYRALRAGAGAIVIAVVLAVWVHAKLSGAPLDMVWDVLVVALVLASGYAVYGHETMSAAVDEAQELTDGSEGDDGDA